MEKKSLFREFLNKLKTSAIKLFDALKSVTKSFITDDTDLNAADLKLVEKAAEILEKRGESFREVQIPGSVTGYFRSSTKLERAESPSAIPEASKAAARRIEEKDLEL